MTEQFTTLLQPVRALIVDDEVDVAEILAEGLEYAGYETLAVYSGEAALQALKEQPFDVMISDVHMPKMRGDELQRIARENDPHLAVLMITAASDLGTAVQCLKEGVFDYMTKPFDLQDVIARVEKAVERRRLIRENLDYQLNLECRVEEQAARILLMFQNSLEALNHALEAKDEYTRNHSKRVCEFSLAIATHLCPNDEEFLEKLRLGALFHDIGKIGVSETILGKPGKLTEAEFDEIKKHPEIGEMILNPIFKDKVILSVVRHHHEQWNGNGYPDKLAGEAIPLEARIVAVADSYDALTSDRPYRKGMSHERALEILTEGAGKQWDADVVSIFVKLSQPELSDLIAA